MTIKRIASFRWRRFPPSPGGTRLVIGLIYGLILMTVGAALMSQNEGARRDSSASSAGAVIVIVPIFYGIIGFVFGALYALSITSLRASSAH